ncbi:MAG: PepSY domain-containing protein, partial [Halioglobus sp.]|nr:PepSY domain-containing protein [Halioglobus sp.]
DLEQIDFSARDTGGALINQLAPAPLQPVIRDALPGRAQWLSWERLLLDLHSGRLAGRAGVWLADAIGVLLCALVLSGIAMWWLHRRRRQRR